MHTPLSDRENMDMAEKPREISKKLLYPFIDLMEIHIYEIPNHSVLFRQQPSTYR